MIDRPLQPRPRLLAPIRLLVFGFVGLILIGALALSLPIASAGWPLSLIDALFTATSAVCVTGLVVVDTGTDLSLFGQSVVLILIQLGGLGIMTFSTFVLVLLGRKLSFGAHGLLAEAHSHRPGLKLGRLLTNIVWFTVVLEALGFVLLFAGLGREMPTERAAWWALFHSVSAFCNAGFALSAESFVPFRNDWLINLTLIALIVLGGLGFVVLDELVTRFKSMRRGERRRPSLSLHARVVLASSLLLTIGGAAVIWLVESAGELAGLPWMERLLVSLFQSVTARTAGFNTVDIGLLSNASVFILIGLMFVGASPASCGGGVKTTTLAVFWAMVRARFRGEERERLFNRSLTRPGVNRAMTLLLSSVGVIGLFTILVFLLMPESADRGLFVKIIFEVVSAFGTVGLSLGITPELTAPAKAVVMVLMLVGRLGPLTFAQFLSGEVGPEKYHYAEESILIG